MRVVLDTNVIVSAVTTRGLCADVFRTVLAEHDLVVCSRVLREVRRILSTKFRVPKALVAEYLELIGHDAIMAEEADPPPVSIKDKEDIEILAAAIGGHLEVLVTGDRELQELGRVGDIRILSPREFWEELTAGGE